MADVGNLNIKVSANTTQLEGSLNRVNSELNRSSALAKGANSDFQRMSNIGGNLSTILQGVGAASGFALLNIAKGAPATASAMARLENSFTRFQIIAGEATQGVFDKIAEGSEKVVNQLESNPPLANLMLGNAGLIAAAGSAGALLTKLTSIGGLGTISVGVSLFYLKDDIEENVKGIVERAALAAGAGQETASNLGEVSGGAAGVAAGAGGLFLGARGVGGALSGIGAKGAGALASRAAGPLAIGYALFELASAAERRRKEFIKENPDHMRLQPDFYAGAGIGVKASAIDDAINSMRNLFGMEDMEGSWVDYFGVQSNTI